MDLAQSLPAALGGWEAEAQKAAGGDDAVLRISRAQTMEVQGSNEWVWGGEHYVSVNILTIGSRLQKEQSGAREYAGMRELDETGGGG